jgi:single-stranded-DNA-specific exonuclease
MAVLAMTVSRIVERASEGWEGLPDTWPLAVRKILAARGIKQEQDLCYPLAELPKPQQLLGMDEAVSLLIQALTENWRITIVADFDTDGATSCAVAIRGLIAMGVSDIDYIVPNRFTHGYGLTPALLDEITPEEQPDLLITVDNGIASNAGVKAAQNRGMKVLVTDHHLPGEVLPTANAIINPNQEGDSFPSKHLAGVGVCFYLLLGLRQRLRQLGWFEQQGITEPNLMTLTDLLALGTVADVVKLDRLNRTWVSLGLARIKAGKGCAGITALMTVAGKDIRQCTSSDMGFAVGPRLNAAGRLDNMGIGIETLLTDDLNVARALASELDEINQQRRNVEQTMQEDALAQLDQLSFDNDEVPLGYCLYDESWHQGVVGLLASRIKEKQHRPVIAFAPNNETEIKGSARSIPGVHIRDVLALVASKAPDVLSHFGGHAMAAGVTIEKANLAEFHRLFLMALEEMVEPESLNKRRLSDGELSCDEMTESLAEQLPHIASWGQGFPEPQFHGVFRIESFKLVGQCQNHLKLTVRLADQRCVTAMAFGQIQPDWLQVGQQALLRYRLDINEFRSQRQLQLLVEELLPLSDGVE